MLPTSPVASYEREHRLPRRFWLANAPDEGGEVRVGITGIPSERNGLKRFAVGKTVIEFGKGGATLLIHLVFSCK